MLIDIRHNHTFAFALFGIQVDSQYRDLRLEGPWGEIYIGEDQGLGVELWKGIALVWQTVAGEHRIPRIDRVGRFRWKRSEQ